MEKSTMNRIANAISPERVARGLGWFSIGLGVAELLAPKAFTRALGMEGREAWVRTCAAREIAGGVGILSGKKTAAWVGARVAGDVLDLAVLANGYRDANPKKANVAIALGAVTCIAAIDAWCARTLASKPASLRVVARDYSDRSGFPRSPEHMRGLARQALPPSMGDGHERGAQPSAM